jgi:hypothetical protein
MLSPKDLLYTRYDHEARVKQALERYELRQQVAALTAGQVSLPVQAAARLGDVLVQLGTRLQAADPRRVSEESLVYSR